MKRGSSFLDFNTSHVRYRFDKYSPHHHKLHINVTLQILSAAAEMNLYTQPEIGGVESSTERMKQMFLLALKCDSGLWPLDLSVRSTLALPILSFCTFNLSSS
ncbi:hypothetical protein J6590_032126 [Homalodisca vitripennis]|nr:hypothetical protein J6590_032126 [Homalodisca vitripennis]